MFSMARLAASAGLRLLVGGPPFCQANCQSSRRSFCIDRPSKRFSKRGGLTLLELMIVLVILVAVMSVAWPRITGQIQLVAPREAAIQLKSDLSEAREQAVVNGEPWAMRIERFSGNYEFGPVTEFSARDDSSMASSALGVDVGSQLLQQIETSTTAYSSASTTASRSGNNAVTGSPDSPYPTDGSFSSPFGQPASAIEQRELPVGMIFDDGWAHSTRDVNQFRLPDSAQNQTVLPPPAPVAINTTGAAGNVQTNQPTDAAGAPILPSPSTEWKYVTIFQPDGRATEAEIRLKDQGSQALIRLRIRGFTGGVTIDAVERKKKLPADLVLDPDAAIDPNVPGTASPLATGQTLNSAAGQGTLSEANGLPNGLDGSGAYPSPATRERRGLEPIR